MLRGRSTGRSTHTLEGPTRLKHVIYRILGQSDGIFDKRSPKTSRCRGGRAWACATVGDPDPVVYVGVVSWGIQGSSKILLDGGRSHSRKLDVLTGWVPGCGVGVVPDSQARKATLLT
jgi:hypothetical protein